ncbi:probable E3 ubiquitin-protein ligase BAH1-like 1 [Cornus florida]|uniref:probable E3 ubiquitin-protein ligase BAH1-like 1 n=1 Tax=Cornus florida TaxID=4283 RepID=UPI00289E6DEB|nr:probable E3 ubiquitin-protein ligase BAH1-like 1 [Cornus florida]
MKFGKKYQLERQGQDEKKLAGIGHKELKKILKNCRRYPHFPDHGGVSTCPVCDGVFFQTLLKEMSAVVRCFNKRAKKLIERHHSSGFHKYFISFKDKLQGNHIDLIQEGKDLITYALINTVAMRKLLKKYDKIHFSKKGQAFKSQAQSMHIEILQSPWLYELMAFHVNSRRIEANTRNVPVLFEGCSVICKPSLSCHLFDSLKFGIDLTCSICLETVFDAVSLTCGHIFCHMCACKAASVTIVDGMKAADPKEKCPLCREEGVYEGAVHLEELNILLSRSCPEYWDERLQMERVERVRQAKEHWESQCRAFMGV